MDRENGRDVLTEVVCSTSSVRVSVELGNKANPQLLYWLDILCVWNEVLVLT
jgi:hypothetical protein